MIIRILTLLTLLFFLQTNYIFSQNLNEEKKANDYLSKKHEVYFKFNISSKEEIKTLTKIISIDNILNNEVFAYANFKEFQKFKALNYKYTVLPHPGDAEVKMYNNTKGIWQFDTYPSYTDYLTMMSTFETNYPGLCKIVQVGTTVNGRKLLCAKITDSVNTLRKVPKFMYLSSMHGDETTGYVLMLRLINYLLTNYGTDQRITDLLDNMEIWIMPLSNPDGTYYSGNTSVTGSVRYNGNSVDLNRNYKNFAYGDHPDGEAWQPETIALMNLADSLHFVMSCSFHGGIECVNYPWDSYDSSTKLHADDTWWQFISHEFADTTRANSPSTYMNPSGTNFYNGVTNGGDWYVVYGSHQDYMNYYKFSRAITIEISNTKTLAASNLLAHWTYNYKSFLNLMEQTLYGIKGTVTDACTGQPVVAKVFVNSHDVDSSWVFSDSIFGDYYRPIYAGTYSMTVSALGYQTQTISNISVTNYHSTVKNIVLNPSTPTADFVADNVTSCSGIINFTNTSNATINSTWLWDFGDGTTDTTYNASHNYTVNGVYTVKLTVGNCVGNNQKIRANYITINMPASPVTTSATICNSGSTTLAASGSGIINWYASSTGGTIINTGITYTTPVLTSTTTYYVGNEIVSSPVYGAKPNNTGGGGYLSNPAQYLIFDCYTPLTLVSVNIYANSTGNRTIELRDNAGAVIQSATVSVPITGLNTVTLNFSVPVGTNMQLGLSSSSASDLYRNNVASGISFPYLSTGLISVTNSSAGTGYYYYFYNWKLQTSSCFSALSPVTATISSLPIPNFSSNSNSLNVNFTNTTIDGTSYYWDFGDFTNSTSTNPSHTYLSAGTYNVKLIATNSCGSDSITIPVTIILSGINTDFSENINIYPNPADNSLFISLKNINTGELRISINDIIDNEIYNKCFEDIKNDFFKFIDLSYYPSGMYFIKIVYNNKINIRKVIIK